MQRVHSGRSEGSEAEVDGLGNFAPCSVLKKRENSLQPAISKCEASKCHHFLICSHCFSDRLSNQMPMISTRNSYLNKNKTKKKRGNCIIIISNKTWCFSFDLCERKDV